MATLLRHLCEKPYLNKSTKTSRAFLVSSSWLLCNRQHAWILTLRLVSQDDPRGRVIFLILKMFYFFSLHVFMISNPWLDKVEGRKYICMLLPPSFSRSALTVVSLHRYRLTIGGCESPLTLSHSQTLFEMALSVAEPLWERANRGGVDEARGEGPVWDWAHGSVLLHSQEGKTSPPAVAHTHPENENYKLVYASIF